MATYRFTAPASGALSSSAADLFIGQGSVDRVTQLCLCNTGATQRAVTIYRKPSGGSDEEILAAFPLPAGETLNVVQIAGQVHLAPGDALRGKQDAGTDVRWTLSAVRMTG